VSNVRKADSALTPLAAELGAGGRAPGFDGSSEELNDMAQMAQALAWGRDEAEVVTELQAGSAAAFDALIQHFHGPLFRLLCQMLGNSADAADTTQEVFLKAFRGIHGFRQGSSLKTWLYRIAIREALNQRRWWRRHQSKETSYSAGEMGDEPLGVAADPTPFEVCATRETQQAVRRALARLPEAFRGAVVLRDLEGLAYEEIADVLEISIGTVKSRILRGRRTLKDLLEAELGGAKAGAKPGGIMTGEMAGDEP
jgi:RNA polymerase sigma-70 factor, ECF subfamily